MFYELTPVGQFLVIAEKLRAQLATLPFRTTNALQVKHLMQQAEDLRLLVQYIPEVSFCINWESLMAKKSPDFNLIDYRLSDKEMEDFDTWLNKEAPNPTEVLNSLAALNYKVSFTFVESSNAWCVSITGKEGAKFNEKATLTSWSDDSLDALYVGAFKVFVVFANGIWKTKVQSRRG